MGDRVYALDITDPASPKALWEYTETNMGHTYGNPEITKLADGTWVVLVTSGYNNITPGDGVGRLYVMRADTGRDSDRYNSTDSNERKDHEDCQEYGSDRAL